jgi:hypothetical protein
MRARDTAPAPGAALPCPLPFLQRRRHRPTTGVCRTAAVPERAGRGRVTQGRSGACASTACAKMDLLRKIGEFPFPVRHEEFDDAATPRGRRRDSANCASACRRSRLAPTGPASRISWTTAGATRSRVGTRACVLADRRLPAIRRARAEGHTSRPSSQGSSARASAAPHPRPRAPMAARCRHA